MSPALFALGERLGLAPFERIFAGFVLDPEGCTLQPEDLAKGTLKISRVAGRNAVEAAAVYHDQRRIAAALMGIAHLGCEASAFGRLLFFQRSDQSTGEFGG